MQNMLLILREDAPDKNRYVAVEVGPTLKMDLAREPWSGWVGTEPNAEVLVGGDEHVCSYSARGQDGRWHRRVFVRQPGFRFPADCTDFIISSLPEPNPQLLVLEFAQNLTSVCLASKVRVASPAFFTEVPSQSRILQVVVEPAVFKLGDLADLKATFRRYLWVTQVMRQRMSELLDVPPPNEPPAWTEYQRIAAEMDFSPHLYLPVHAEAGTEQVPGVFRIINVAARGLLQGELILWGDAAIAVSGTTLSRTVSWAEGADRRSLTQVVGRIA